MESEVVVNILSLFLMAASIAGTWMIFAKAGERGWKAVIPFYNYYILLRITRHSGWWVAALAVPAVLIFIAGSTVTYQLIELSADGARALVEMIAIIILISAPIAITINAVVMYDIARAFGKRLPFTVGLTLLPFIFLVWLGFGDETFRGVPEDRYPDSNEGSSDDLINPETEEEVQEDEVSSEDEKTEEEGDWDSDSHKTEESEGHESPDEHSGDDNNAEHQE